MIKMRKSTLAILLAFSVVLGLTNYSYAEGSVSDNNPIVEVSVSDNDSTPEPEDNPVIEEPIVEEPVIEDPIIDIPELSSSDVSASEYSQIVEEINNLGSLDINFSKTEFYVKKGSKFNLKITGSDYVGGYKKASKSWSSSDKKVAKVDSKGAVTAVGAGLATITCDFKDQTLTCLIHVYDITSLTFTNNGSTKLSRTYINGTLTDNDFTIDESDAEDLTIDINQKNPDMTAYQIYLHTSNGLPTISSSNKKVATATCTLMSNQIKIHIVPKTTGSTVFTITFAGKTASLKYSVKNSIKSSWFDIKYDERVYNGKALKNSIILNDLPKGVTYKTVYKNNIKVGTATVTVYGTGSYTGSIEFNYEILPIDISDATFTATKSRIFSGEPRPATVNVIYKKVKLKKGRDYEVQYKEKSSNIWSTDVPVNAGEYQVRAEGIGNYSGVISDVADYVINKANLVDITLRCSSTVKYKKGAPVYPKISLICKDTVISQTTNGKANYNITYSIRQKDGSYQKVDAPTIVGTYMVTIETCKPNIIPVEDEEGKLVRNTISKTFTVK